MCVNPTAFLPHITGLRLDHVVVTDQLITLTLTCVGQMFGRPKIELLRQRLLLA